MSFVETILEDLQAKPVQLLAIVGPTCTGKSDLAIELAQELKIPIINSDSRLIYSEMNIGTAKPKSQELELVKHYLVNLKTPDQHYSAGDYRTDFDQVIQSLKTDAKSLSEKQPLAVVVGGTGLYLRSALENLNMPEVSRDMELRENLKQKSLDELQKQLDELDPEASKQVDIQNKVRVIRAIEIVLLSGKSLAENRSKGSENRYQVNFYGLNFERRHALYDLINYRVIKMIKQGLVHEVEALVNKYGETEVLNSTIGYKELLPYLRRECSLSDARRLIQKRTRQYAKKQMTWFKQNRSIQWFYR